MVGTPQPRLASKLRARKRTLGTDIDFSHYEQPGHERDSLYDNSLVREELGFVPKVNVLTDYKG